MDFTLNQTNLQFIYDYLPVYIISIQYTNLIKRYRTETTCVTYGTDRTDGTDVRSDSDGTLCPRPSPTEKGWGGHKKLESETLYNYNNTYIYPCLIFGIAMFRNCDIPWYLCVYLYSAKWAILKLNPRFFNYSA